MTFLGMHCEKKRAAVAVQESQNGCYTSLGEIRANSSWMPDIYHSSCWCQHDPLGLTYNKRLVIFYTSIR
jgi:hypothetical protein